MEQEYIKGDIVMYNNKIHTIMDTLGVNNYELSCISHPVHQLELSGVPVTPEILEKNGWKRNGKGLFIVKQVPSHIEGDIIPKMQSLPQSAKNILMKRENPHIDYTNQMLIINPNGRADSWVPSSSDVFAEDWEVVTD